MRQLGKMVVGLALLGLVAAVPVSAQSTLWYNGDWNGGSGTVSATNLPGGYSSTLYDNFIVSASGWTVTGLTGTFMSYVGYTTANWEIRSGITEGDGGSLLFSGTSPATYTSIGSGDFGTDLVRTTIDVSAYSIFLTPGTYWLGISPILSFVGATYLAPTSGTNGVNALLDNTVIWNEPCCNINFLRGGYVGSLGVTGYVGTNTVPEPATLTLLATGLVGLAGVRRRKKNR